MDYISLIRAKQQAAIAKARRKAIVRTVATTLVAINGASALEATMLATSNFPNLQAPLYDPNGTVLANRSFDAIFSTGIHSYIDYASGLPNRCNDYLPTARLRALVNRAFGPAADEVVRETYAFLGAPGMAIGSWVAGAVASAYTQYLRAPLRNKSRCQDGGMPGNFLDSASP